MLLSDAPDASGTVSALKRLALICPRSSAEAEAAWALRHDARLADAVASLAGASQLGIAPRCAALWSLGMCWDSNTPHRSAARLRTAAAAMALLSNASFIFLSSLPFFSWRQRNVAR